MHIFFLWTGMTSCNVPDCSMAEGASNWRLCCLTSILCKWCVELSIMLSILCNILLSTTSCRGSRAVSCTEQCPAQSSVMHRAVSSPEQCPAQSSVQHRAVSCTEQCPAQSSVQPRAVSCPEQCPAQSSVQPRASLLYQFFLESSLLPH